MKSIVGYEKSKTTAFFKTGTGVLFDFKEVKIGDGEGVVYGIALGDINKDGFPDIAVARSDAVNLVYISQKNLMKK